MLYVKATFLALLANQATAAPVAGGAHKLAAQNDAPMTPADCPAACAEVTPNGYVHAAFGVNTQTILDAFQYGCKTECEDPAGWTAPTANPACFGASNCLYTVIECDDYCENQNLPHMWKHAWPNGVHETYRAMKDNCKAVCEGIEANAHTVSYPLGGRDAATILSDCNSMVPINVTNNFGGADGAIMVPAIKAGCVAAATSFYDRHAAISPTCGSTCLYDEMECSIKCGISGNGINLHHLWKNWDGSGESSIIYHAAKHACKETCMNLA